MFTLVTFSNAFATDSVSNKFANIPTITRVEDSGATVGIKLQLKCFLCKVVLGTECMLYDV